MIEMFSKSESRLILIALLVYVLLVVAITTIITMIIEIRNAKKAQKMQDQTDVDDNEMFVCVSDDEYYAIAQKALDEQKMLDFKCRMNGIDKAIHILKDGK